MMQAHWVHARKSLCSSCVDEESKPSTAEKETKLQAERDAAELETKLQAERDAAELEAKLQAEIDAAEQEAKLQAERDPLIPRLLVQGSFRIVRFFPEVRSSVHLM